jgi:hypothetical protein
VALFLFGTGSLSAQPKTDRVHDKQIVTEVRSLLEEDTERVAAIKALPQTQMLPELKSMLIMELDLDISLVEDNLRMFRHHQCSRTKLDKYLNQLSRDLEIAEAWWQ